MQVKLLYFAQLRQAAKMSEQMIDLERPVSVGEFVRGVLARPEFEACRELPLRYAMNDEFVGPEQWVEDKAVLAILPPVAGG